MRHITDAFSRWIQAPLAFAGLALLALLSVGLLMPTTLIWTAILIVLSYTWLYHHKSASPCLRYVLDNSDFMTFYSDNHLFTLIFGIILAHMSWLRRRRIKRSAQFWISAIFLGYTSLSALRNYGSNVLDWILILETAAIWTQRFALSMGTRSRVGTEPTTLYNLRHNPRWASYFILEFLAYFLHLLFTDRATNRWTSCLPYLLINTTFCLYISSPRQPEMTAKNTITRHTFDLTNEPYYCTVCKRLLDRRREAMVSDEPIEDAPHHFWRSSVRREAKSGCRICVVVWQSWLHTPVLVSGVLAVWKPVTSYSWRCDGQGFEIESNIASNIDTTPHTVIFKIFDKRADKHQWHSVNRDVGNCTWSPRVIRIIKSWLMTCKHKHEQCHSPVQGSSSLPTRLIQIMQRSEGLHLALRLTNTCTEPLQYVTLSHCWGQIEDGKLKPENYSDYLMDIPFESLPLNFRHAAQIAADLGFEYIWIDSLCILQGCTEDWDREAPMMRNVYANSACNLAATDASDSTQGLIFARDPVSLFPATCSFDESMYLTNNTDSFGHPLYRRAWVMQELLLAPRTLHFGRAQVYWSCNNMIASEVYPDGFSEASVSHLDHHPAFDFALSHDNGATTILNAKLMESRLRNIAFYRNFCQQLEMDSFPSVGAGALPLLSAVRSSGTGSVSIVMNYKKRAKIWRASDSQHPFHYWAILVEAYTNMNITMTADRPVAIFGIVLLLKPHLGKYLGGLWRAFLPMELLWETCITSRRPHRYQAPSWSWLSVEGPIYYTRCYKLEHGQTFMLTIVDADVYYDVNETLMTRWPGWLRVRGKLAGVYWDGQAYKHTYKAHMQPVVRQIFAAGSVQGEDVSSHYTLPRRINESAPRIYFDELQDQYHLDEDLFLLAVRRGFWDSDSVFNKGHWDSNVEKGEAVDGLVLRRHHRGLEYVRVGTFTDAGLQPLLPFFDLLPETDITIV